ncbi:hypothetical protein LBMAG07_03250 [Actinomycetes bacterium]|nr:hypothetical protein LBMAG07_03250 [Actinomycetes bacterium]
MLFEVENYGRFVGISAHKSDEAVAARIGFAHHARVAINNKDWLVIGIHDGSCGYCQWALVSVIEFMCAPVAYM